MKGKNRKEEDPLDILSHTCLEVLRLWPNQGKINAWWCNQGKRGDFLLELENSGKNEVQNNYGLLISEFTNVLFTVEFSWFYKLENFTYHHLHQTWVFSFSC